MKEIPLYLCDKKRDCNGPCYRYCRLTHDINHAVKDDKIKMYAADYIHRCREEMSTKTLGAPVGEEAKNETNANWVFGTAD